jgi:hypothetical protein
MEGIYEADASFSFSNLTLTKPTLVSGGYYFITFLVNQAPLYIKTPKCGIKGGIAKAGKRYNCDLMFSNENEEFILWMERLEQHICKSLYDNRGNWFESEMEMSDIEESLASPMKIYKSGKFYLLRTNLYTRLGKISAKIYDEHENDFAPETIGEDHKVISILEIQGIKCSSRSFQVEIEMKQMMVLSPVNLFEKCILGKGRIEPSVVSSPSSVELNSEVATITEEAIIEEKKEEDIQEMPKVNPLENSEPDETPLDKSETIQESESQISNSSPEILEVELNLANLDSNDVFEIKARNEVYYELYRQVLARAKTARKMALDAYLEAKQIKQMYHLDISSDTEEEKEEMDFDENV